MKFTIFQIFLLPMALAFNSASVVPTTRNINVSTNYLVTLTLTSALIDAPVGFKVVMVLPNTITVLSSLNSNPTTCVLRDILQINADVSLTTAFSSSNPQNGQCGVSATNTYTLITPARQSTGIRFNIGLIKNPLASYSASNTGSIVFYGYNSGSSTINYQTSFSFASSYFTPGILTLSTFASSDPTVGA